MYTLVSIPGDGLALLSSARYGQQLWVQCKTRKAHQCRECGLICSAGTVMYRPLTNGYNRMERVCVGCVHDMWCALKR